MVLCVEEDRDWKLLFVLKQNDLKADTQQVQHTEISGFVDDSVPRLLSDIPCSMDRTGVVAVMHTVWTLVLNPPVEDQWDIGRITSLTDRMD